MRWPTLRPRTVQLLDTPTTEPLLAFSSTPQAPEPVLLFAVRCPCCGLRASRSAADGSQFCSGQCVACGGPCLGLPLRETVPAAPPLAVRPVEDFNWVMRN